MQTMKRNFILVFLMLGLVSALSQQAFCLAPSSPFADDKPQGVPMQNKHPPLFGQILFGRPVEIPGKAPLRVWLNAELHDIDTANLQTFVELSANGKNRLRIEKQADGKLRLISLDRLNLTNIYFETGTENQVHEAIIPRINESFKTVAQQPEIVPGEKRLSLNERVRLTYKMPIQIWLGASDRLELCHAEDVSKFYPALADRINARFSYYLVNPDNPEEAIGIDRARDYLDLGMRNPDLLEKLKLSAPLPLYARLAWMGEKEFYLEAHARDAAGYRVGMDDEERVDQNVSTILELGPDPWTFVAGLPNRLEFRSTFNDFGAITEGKRAFVLTAVLSKDSKTFECKVKPESAAQVESLPVMLLHRTAEALQSPLYFNPLATILNRVPGATAIKLDIGDVTQCYL